MLKDETNQLKKNYRIIPQPDEQEREDLKARLYEFTTQTKVSGVFKTSMQNINEAFKGNNPTLMNKLKKFIIGYETRKLSKGNGSSVANNIN